MLIGNRIKQLREEKNFSRMMMSYSARLAPNYIYDLEMNRSIPSFRTLEKICDVLGVSLAEFFSEGNGLPGVRGTADPFLEKCEKLSPSQQDVVEALIDVLLAKNPER